MHKSTQNGAHTAYTKIENQDISLRENNAPTLKIILRENLTPASFYRLVSSITISEISLMSVRYSYPLRTKFPQADGDVNIHS